MSANEYDDADVAVVTLTAFSISESSDYADADTAHVTVVAVALKEIRNILDYLLTSTMSPRYSGQMIDQPDHIGGVLLDSHVQGATTPRYASSFRGVTP